MLLSMVSQLPGCLFHLGQYLWRKAQELHPADSYLDNENIRVHVKMLLALSCVSSINVTNALEMLKVGGKLSEGN